MNKAIEEVLNCKQSIVNLTAQHFSYSLEEKRTLKKYKEFYEYLENACCGVELEALTEEDLSRLGWGKWDDDGLMLAPLYWYKALLRKERLILTSISGEDRVIGIDEIDKDSRFGCLAYGIFPGKVKYAPVFHAKETG